MKQFITHSEKETKGLAKRLAKRLSGIIALTGELGAGKTIFTQGFAEGLGIKEKIISPTFVLVRQHPIPNTNQILYHVDLYRLEDFIPLANEFAAGITIRKLILRNNVYKMSNDWYKELGLKEIMENPNNIVLIEWAEKAKDLLPKNTIFINFRALSLNKRQIILS